MMVKIILCKCKFRIELGTPNHLEKKKRIKKARLGLRKLEALASAIKKITIMQEKWACSKLSNEARFFFFPFSLIILSISIITVSLLRGDSANGKGPQAAFVEPFLLQASFHSSYQVYKAHKHWNPEPLRKKERQLGAGEGQRREGQRREGRGTKLKGATQRNLEPLIFQLMRPLIHYKV